VQNGRKALIAALSGITIFFSLALVAPQAVNAEPDIDDVGERVDHLLHEAERAQERLNLATEQMKAVKGELRGLRADQKAQRKDVRLIRQELAHSIVDQYQGATLSTVGQVMISDDPDAFLTQLTNLSTYNGIRDEAYTKYSVALKALILRQEATEERLAEVRKIQSQMAEEKKIVDEKYADAKALLDEMKAKERAALLGGGGGVVPPTNINASGRAKVAVDFAMAQRGDPYVYGAAGPNAWDCSGLTMMAWNAAGVGLPHQSGAQFSSGARVAASALQPGDLVFYYNPISHVGMYIGGGAIVHAPHPGSVVQVTGLYSMPYVGAVRPG
jgi:peptidoglycan DL-endopeptidase CwlO